MQFMYKAWDYRCLVPYSDNDPTKWKTYDMHDYRKASSEAELSKIDKFKYDNNFMNCRDPKAGTNKMRLWLPAQSLCQT